MTAENIFMRFRKIYTQSERERDWHASHLADIVHDCGMRKAFKQKPFHFIIMIIGIYVIIHIDKTKKRKTKQKTHVPSKRARVVSPER